jgi:hypothetical protein
MNETGEDREDREDREDQDDRDERDRDERDQDKRDSKAYSEVFDIDAAAALVANVGVCRYCSPRL